MKFIYLVYGISGEFEDRQEWNVCAFHSEEKAFDYREKLNKIIVDNVGCLYNQGYVPSDKRGPLEQLLKPLDPAAWVDYTSAEYHVASTMVMDDG